MSYYFSGELIKLKKNHYKQWEKEFRYLDLPAELKRCDEYYTNNPPRENKWWFPVKKWLENENRYQKQKRLNEVLPKEIYS